MNPPYPLPFRNFSDAAYWAGINYCNSSTTPATAYVLPIAGAEAAGVGSGYRFGFNGKENDKEGMGGGGSTYDYGFRIYNAQIARFLSVDPLTGSYPWYTPYQFAGNMPVWAIDLDGLEELIATDYYDEVSGTTTRVYHYNRKQTYSEEDIGKVQYKYSDGTTSTGPVTTEDEKKILQMFLKAKTDLGSSWAGSSTTRRIDGKTTAPKPQINDNPPVEQDQTKPMIRRVNPVNRANTSQPTKKVTVHKITSSTQATVGNSNKEIINHINTNTNGLPLIKAQKGRITGLVFTVEKASDISKIDMAGIAKAYGVPFEVKLTLDPIKPGEPNKLPNPDFTIDIKYDVQQYK